MTEEEAGALLQRLGGGGGRIEAARLVGALTAARARSAGAEAVRKGAFPAGVATAFSGKILYRQCRSGVYAPSDWDPNLALRSSAPPSASGAGLQLEFVYGFAGGAECGGNLHLTSTGQHAYYVAGVGVVYDRATHTQRFYRGHDDDIASMALLGGADVEVGGVVYPAGVLAATGQVTPIEGGEKGRPHVAVWDTRSCECVARLDLDAEARVCLALGFSPDGGLLTTVSGDNGHTVQARRGAPPPPAARCRRRGLTRLARPSQVWDWQRAYSLSEGRGANGEPPQVRGVV